MECTIPQDQESPDPVQEETKPIEQDSYEEPDRFWVVHVNASSSFVGSGADLLLLGPKEFVAEYALQFDFSVTNNEAEYEALIAGLRIAKELEV